MLVGYVGWPLPHHVPSWPELQGVLLTPMGTQMLLDILTCICWVAWFAFLVDVLRCTMHAGRGLTLPRPRVARPVQGLAAALVGAVLLSVLGHRTGPPPTTMVLALAEQSTLVVTAPQHPAPTPEGGVVTQALLGQHESIPRTLTLLTTTLAELDQHPSNETTTLAEFLQHHSHRPTPTSNAAAS